jgi:hypothetical protein
MGIHLAKHVGRGGSAGYGSGSDFFFFGGVYALGIKAKRGKFKVAQIQRRRMDYTQNPNRQGKKSVKLSIIASAVMVGVFSGTHAMTNPASWSTQLIVTSWVLFTIALIAINLLLYEYGKKQPSKN